MTLHGADGDINMHPKSGDLVGDKWAPSKFATTLRRPIEQWRRELAERPHGAPHAQHWGSEEKVDLIITTYADDIHKRHVSSSTGPNEEWRS